MVERETGKEGSVTPNVGMGTHSRKGFHVSSSKSRRTQRGIVAAMALVGVLAVSSTPTVMVRRTSAASEATSVPPGAPQEDVRYAPEARGAY